MHRADVPAARQRATAAVVQAMVFAGGVAALSWEVIWQLQASLAFGVSAAGTALTLAATMGGMTCGGLAMGRWLRGRALANPLRLYGALEGVIGVSGLLMLPGFRALERLDAGAYALAPVLAQILQPVAIALLLGPATAAMGASVPVFQLVARRHRTSIAALYGSNTAGAATGVLLLSFWLLPQLGVWRSCAAVAALNGLIASTAFVLRPGAAAQDVAAIEPPRAPAARVRGLTRVAVFATGFVTFGLEVAWFRALRAAFWSTSSTFAIMLASVLIPVAAGARIVPWLRRRGVAPGALLLCGGAAILVGTPGVERIDLLAAIALPHAAVLALWLLVTLAAIGPAMLLLATALPWFLEEISEPAATGLLYGLNTLGSVAGSLAAAWILLPWLGFARSSWLLGLLVVAVSASLQPPRRRFTSAAVGAAALVFAASFTSSAGRDRMFGRPNLAGNRVLAVAEAPDFTTAVIESRDGTRSLFIDGFSATSDHPVSGFYMRWMGRLPALLHPDPRRGLVICFGTGQTANALRLEMAGQIDIVDVSRTVFDLAPYFRVNEGVLSDPRVAAIRMDGRAWLRRSTQRYDVITLEPMPPNFAGMNSLYSREFYEIMARRLEPGGVVAQWLPIHLLSPRHAASVSATFLSVFPDAILWFDPVGATGILVGRRAGASEPLGTDWPGFARGPRKRSLTDEEIRRSALLNAAELARYASAGELVTDDNQMLQFSQLRAGIRARQYRALTKQNQLILTEIAGHIPFQLDRNAFARRRG
jgi:spermidine synthase